MINKCRLCKVAYPEIDKTEKYYKANILGKDVIICRSCIMQFREMK